MRILGIDPGLQITGFGVIDVDGPLLTYVASGTIKTTHLDTGNLPARLKVLFDGICEITSRYQPDCSACEIVFVNVNPQATLMLGQARGACVTALVSCSIEVAEYTPLQMKKLSPVTARRASPRSGDGQTSLETAGPAWQRCGRRAGPGHHPRPCGWIGGDSGKGGHVGPQVHRVVQGRAAPLTLKPAGRRSGWRKR